MDVLDGQQRLAAIRDFFHNNFSVDGGITPLDDKIKSLHGRSYKRLDPPEKRMLDQYTIRCFKITDYLPDETSELFYRLNQPSMLTAGEQRNAFYGPAREQLKNLVDLFEEGGNNKSTIGFSNTRLAYDDIIARLLVFVENGNFSIKSTENFISQRFKQRDGFSDVAVDICKSCIDNFTRERNQLQTLRLNKASTLSWLLFFSRVPDRSFEKGFMGFFHDQLSASRSGGIISAADSVFLDRSSLRVTDVSSVVYRDFALWFAYNFTGNDRAPPYLLRTIERIKELLVSDENGDLEAVLQKNLDVESWGKIQ